MRYEKGGALECCLLWLTVRLLVGGLWGSLWNWNGSRQRWATLLRCWLRNELVDWGLDDGNGIRKWLLWTKATLGVVTLHAKSNASAILLVMT